MSWTTAPEAVPSSRFHPRRRSLAWRLTAWYAGTAFALVALATAFLYWALTRDLDREDDEFLADKVEVLRTLLRDRPKDADLLKEEVELEPAARQYARVYVRLLDQHGQSIRETPGMAEVLPTALFPSPAAVGEEAGPGVEVTSAAGLTFRVVAARAVGSAAVIQVAMDRSRDEDLLAGYRRYLWLALGTALVACAAAAHQIARRGLRPLAEVTAAAQAIGPATLDRRLAADGRPAEIAVLAEKFNDMLDRLQESFDRLGRFSADIAHELRNPVNSLRGEAEVALGRPRSAEEYREVLGSCLEECGRLAGMIDNLLLLARAESPETQIARSPLDLRRELETIRDFYDAAASEAGVSLTVDAPPGLHAELDRTLVQRALANLVANALAHTPRGGAITLAARREPGAVRIDVIDTGSGIPAEHLPHVFDRFYRADAARPTASGRVGLGLAIVKGIAALHRGSVAVASEVGKGTRVSLLFPQDGGQARQGT
jgi:two-component system heavy metal sensor histidine kinase CusS